MQVLKRNGNIEQFDIKKIIKNGQLHCRDDLVKVDIVSLCQNIQEKIYHQITTSEISELLAKEAISHASEHYHYDVLAVRILLENYNKDLEWNMSTIYEDCFYEGLISDDFWSMICTHGVLFQGMLNKKNDENFNYFGLKTLEKNYLLKINGRVVEQPQHMYMRVAIMIHLESLMEYHEKIPKELEKNVKKTYDLLSEHYYTHATPTLFNAGTKKQQYASCYLVPMLDDSIDGIYETLTNCAKISQSSGGIGINVSNIRCKGSIISSTGGKSNGILPMLRVFNESSRYINQGGKRKGSYAIYLEPWHGDILEFLEIKKNHGFESMRCRDLFQALWISDLFMKRVNEDGMWSLFCPSKVDLFGKYGTAFEEEYERCERSGFAVKTMKARRLWNKILTAQIETGGPFMLYKDACNKKSNQNNCGTIVSSNLCTEIVQFHNSSSFGVCNLASISLPKFVKKNGFDFMTMEFVVKEMVNNLNLLSRQNNHVLDECQADFEILAPIGIGVQGLGDVFQMLDIPFNSMQARKLNKAIFEKIYYAAVKESCVWAEYEGTYEKYDGSLASRGYLQFDLWENAHLMEQREWKVLKNNVKQFGLYNSLLTTVMPTASTAHIMGNNEACDPIINNYYVRRVLAGEYEVINKRLIERLEELGLWNGVTRNKIMQARGSVQGIIEIPKSIREVFKTIWEIPQKCIIDMAIERAPFIDQSQSMTLYMENPTFEKLTSAHFYGWENGLKTGMYYLRTKSAHNAIQFTVKDEEEICESCTA